jgi:hypothetical protein
MKCLTLGAHRLPPWCLPPPRERSKSAQRCPSDRADNPPPIVTAQFTVPIEPRLAGRPFGGRSRIALLAEISAGNWGVSI